MALEPNGLAGATAGISKILGGGLVTSLVTLGVAALGFMMLTGRLEIRRGILATLGCFLMIGAQIIARDWTSSAPARVEMAGSEAFTAQPTDLKAREAHQVEDPYAGASLAK